MTHELKVIKKKYREYANNLKFRVRQRPGNLFTENASIFHGENFYREKPQNLLSEIIFAPLSPQLSKRQKPVNCGLS